MEKTVWLNQREYDPFDTSPENLELVVKSFQPKIKATLSKFDPSYGYPEVVNEVCNDILVALWKATGTWEAIGEARPALNIWASKIVSVTTIEWLRTNAPTQLRQRGSTGEDRYFESSISPGAEQLKLAFIRRYGADRWDEIVANASHAKRGVNARAQFLTLCESLDTYQ